MYKQRHIEQNVIELSTCNKIVLITGARQVGKSTLLTHLFPSMKHITFDPLHDTYGARADSDLFLKSFPSPIILDEIQYVPELLSALKRLVDTNTNFGQYFLTGSQNFLMMKEISETLAGRVAILNLYPMTQLEMHSHSSHWLDKYLMRDVDFHKNLEAVSTAPLFETIWRGGMPALIDRTANTLPNYFESYLRTYIERDILTTSNIQNIQNFTLFARFLAANTAQEINLSHLGREVGVSPATAAQWKTVLQMTYFWLELPAYHKNAIKKITHKSKGYVFDTGMACHLQRITSADALSQYPGRGALFENYCVNQIHGYLQKKISSPQLYHWRTTNNAEIDLILEQDGWLFPIEFKCKTTVNGNDAKWFKRFKETHSDAQIFKGVIVYAGDVVRYVTEDVIAIPWNFVAP
jgi:predicted AAA+ superfamily ATPase